MDSVILTATPPAGVKLFTDKEFKAAFTSDTITKKANDFYPNFEKTLYFTADSTIVSDFTDTGKIINVAFTATNGIIDQSADAKINIYLLEVTNYATLKLSKTELKDIKTATDVTGTIEFKHTLVSDVTYTVDSNNNDLTGITFKEKTIAMKTGARSATFTITIQPLSTSATIEIQATCVKDSAIAAKIFNQETTLDNTISVTVKAVEANGFVDATKDVIVTPKKDLIVKIPFKFKKSVKEDVIVAVSCEDHLSIPGTDFANDSAVTYKAYTVKANKKGFDVAIKIKDIAKFNAYKEQTFVFTATVTADYSKSDLTKGAVTTNTLVTKEIVSKYIKAELSWTIDGKTPTADQLKGTDVVKTDSKISFFIDLTKNMGSQKDSGIITLVDSALADNTHTYTFTTKFDKNAQLAFGISSEYSKEFSEIEIKGTDSKVKITGGYGEFPITYCAAKKLKANITLVAKTKGVKLGTKKATILVGDELNLDPFAIIAMSVNGATAEVAYKSANTYTDIIGLNNKIELKQNQPAGAIDITAQYKVNITTGAGYTKTQKAIIKLYNGTGVAKNEIFSATKDSFVEGTDTKLITVAPALSFYVCDPITNPNELKSAKKFALKAPKGKGKDFDIDAKTIDYTIASSPIVYNKSELSKYRNGGNLFCDLNPGTDTRIQPKRGHAGGTVMMAWKQGKKNEAAYIDFKEPKDKSDSISVVVFAPAFVDSIFGTTLFTANTSKDSKLFNYAKDKDSGMMLNEAGSVSIIAGFVNEKTTLSAEYVDIKTKKTKVVSFKFNKDPENENAVTCTPAEDGKKLLTFPINQTTAKAFKNIKDNEFYLIFDNGTGLTSPKVKFTFDTDFFTAN